MPTSTSWATDRGEAIERPEASRAVVLVPGVELRPMAGAHNGARGLFTGLLTLAPGASIPYHARPTAEAMVLLEGDAAVDVEDRRYRLGPLDAIAVMPGRPRRLANLSAESARRVPRRAGARRRPSRTGSMAGSSRPSSRPPPPAATGPSASSAAPCAPVTELAPHAMFQDLYNAELGTHGICGGYGLFAPGARLPCHRHQFDESITIVQGTATCVVEGRRHELAGFATAMVPQGRCHYFINLTLEPMAMIWVYAGDMPDRIVMDEHFCHPEKRRG